MTRVVPCHSRPKELFPLLIQLLVFRHGRSVPEPRTRVVWSQARRAPQSRREKLAAESAADGGATEIAKLLYERGVESFLSVLDAKRSLWRPAHAGERRAAGR